MTSMTKYVNGLSDKEFLLLSLAVDERKHRMNLRRAENAGVYPLDKKEIRLAQTGNVAGAAKAICERTGVKLVIAAAVARQAKRNASRGD